ncbi:stage V sporulation protein AF [Gracilibacillus halophilus YIM-C55.5]|uniref:Stage V sporulation protein AF n=1 Tax=Gracilibacillus halophilus YIM-C55.5 TaxID=1308866 RepID=N4WDZ4_9BACI|nr:spore germination protein [Gracilibacillus halophilus]ENH97469.1 stage V sporulation protein AF [Gracilibacillus halophilus YIM-C55.5]
MEQEKGLYHSYEKNVHYIRDYLKVEKSFDLIHLDLEYAGRKMSLFLVDGLVKDEILHYLMRFLAQLEEEDLDDKPFEKLMQKYIPYVEIDKEKDLNKAADWVLSGPSALVVEGLDKIILIDARTYPVRSPKEPDLERVVRGARDGFVETIIFNTALTRRKIRDRSLRMEYMSIGRRSKTDICISYIADIADPKKVEQLKKHLDEIDTDGLPMAEKTIEEYLSGKEWNPYPTIRYTERPDTAAAHMYEGHIVIMIDGSPSVMITPATLWHHLQHAEEYRQKPFIGVYLKMVRYIAIFSSIFILPMYYLLSTEPGLLPEELSFVGPQDVGKIPLIFQFLIAEIGIDMLRMAAIHTPSALATALGLVSAILIGQIAVEVGLFSNEVVLYLAVAVMGTYCTPSYELSLANRIIRLGLLLVTAFFGLKGFVIGTTVYLLYLINLNTFYIGYLWPFIPFDGKALYNVIIRRPVPSTEVRPSFLRPQDPDKNKS